MFKVPLFLVYMTGRARKKYLVAEKLMDQFYFDASSLGDPDLCFGDSTAFRFVIGFY